MGSAQGRRRGGGAKGKRLGATQHACLRRVGRLRYGCSAKGVKVRCVRLKLKGDESQDTRDSWFKVGEFFFFVIRTCPVILTQWGHDISVFLSSCQARIGRDRNLATEPSQRVSSSSSRISRIVSTLTTKPTHVLSPTSKSLGHQHPLPLPGTVERDTEPVPIRLFAARSSASCTRFRLL